MRPIRHRLSVIVATGVLGFAACLGAGEAAAPADPPSGHLALVSASIFGGDGDESVAGVAIQSDRSIVAVGSCAAPFAIPGLARTDGAGQGFILRLDPAGKPRSIVFTKAALALVRIGPQDRLVVRDAAGEVSIFDRDARKRLGGFAAPLSDKPTLAVDDGGGIVLTSGAKLQRYAPDGKLAWEATPPAHGGNRLRACAVDPATGISIAVGYGMTHTGKEPYKDPYAHAYDRSGKRLWTLWNPDPKDQKAAAFGGTGLMADGTGNLAASTADGGFLIGVHHDGGNAVTTRDAQDPRKPLDAEVFAGAYQTGPGHGMKGAITTSVIFRVDPTTGKLLKGTWMCAWMNNHSRANSLFMNDVAADGTDVYLVGASGSELVTKLPWFAHREGEYTGGAFLAAFDQGFAMLQCGSFDPGELSAVAARDGLVVVAGRAKGQGKDGKPVDEALRIRLEKPAAQDRVKGAGDALLVILRRHDRPLGSRPALPVAPMEKAVGPSGAQPVASPAWDAAFSGRLSAAITAGRTIDVEAFGARRQIVAYADGKLTLRQGQGELNVAMRVLDLDQRVEIARQLAKLDDAMDQLVAAYYLRLSGDGREAGLCLARAGRSAEVLDQPPQEAK